MSTATSEAFDLEPYQDPLTIQRVLNQAKTVAIAGDFNQWNLQPLKPSQDGMYAVELSLPQGSYAYSFVVDGKQWIPDPSAEKKIEDGFGGFNSLLNL